MKYTNPIYLNEFKFPSFQRIRNGIGKLGSKAKIVANDAAKLSTQDVKNYFVRLGLAGKDLSTAVAIMCTPPMPAMDATAMQNVARAIKLITKKGYDASAAKQELKQIAMNPKNFARSVMDFAKRASAFDMHMLTGTFPGTSIGLNYAGPNPFAPVANALGLDAKGFIDLYGDVALPYYKMRAQQAIGGVKKAFSGITNKINSIKPKSVGEYSFNQIQQ